MALNLRTAIIFVGAGVIVFIAANKIAYGLITPNELKIENGVLDCDDKYTPVSCSFNAKVTNTSPNYPLQSIFVTVQLHDCQNAMLPTQCPIIGEEQIRIATDIPQKQTRAVDGHCKFYSVPQITGTKIKSYTSWCMVLVIMK